MPRVWNKAWEEVPPEAVYVGRPSRFGNPYSHKPGTLAQYRVDTVQQALEYYREYIDSDPVLYSAVVNELKGKDLVCWCAPRPCHADILLEIANG